MTTRTSFYEHPTQLEKEHEMQRRNLFIGAAAPVLIAGLMLMGSTPAMSAPSATAPAPADTAASEAAAVQAADEAGYLIVEASEGIPATGGATFYPTGEIDDDTLVVFAEPDGSLPGGITEAQLSAIVAQGDSISSDGADSLGFTLEGDSLVADEDSAVLSTSAVASPSAVLASHAYAATSASWSSAYTGGSVIGINDAATVQYTFTASAFTSQRNVGQGLGYYRGYNGSQFGTWAKWYSLGSGTSSSAGGAAVPWGNAAGVAKFMGKCATTTACGGYFTP